MCPLEQIKQTMHGLEFGQSSFPGGWDVWQGRAAFVSRDCIGLERSGVNVGSNIHDRTARVVNLAAKQRTCGRPTTIEGHQSRPHTKDGIEHETKAIQNRSDAGMPHV